MNYRISIFALLLLLCTGSVWAETEVQPATETPSTIPTEPGSVEESAKTPGPQAGLEQQAEAEAASTEERAMAEEKVEQDQAVPVQEDVAPAPAVEQIEDPCIPRDNEASADILADQEICPEDATPVAETPEGIAVDTEGAVVPAAVSAEEGKVETEVVVETGDEEDEEDEENQEEKETVIEGRMRFEIGGGVSIPSTGEDVSGGIGGVLGYDFFDTIGIELYLSQVWGSTKLGEKSIDTKILSVRPGARYRFYKTDISGQDFRAYIMGHVGFSQVKWPDLQVDRDNFDEGFGCDGGAGIEFRFADILLLDVFGMYEFSMDNMPQDATGKLDNYHGFFIGAALGISSSL